MEGAAHAAARRADENTQLAYQGIVFYALATKGKLMPVKEYLIDKPKPKKAQTPEEMLAAFHAFAAAGAPITIREVN